MDSAAPVGTRIRSKETALKMLKMLTLITVLATSFGLAYAGDCSSSCAGDCCAKTDIEVYGSARYRLEIDGRSFAADTNMDWMQYMRSRLGVKASRGTSGMVFEVQDSRILGDAPGTLEMTNGQRPSYTFFDKSNTLGYRNDFGVRQAYLFHKPCEKGYFQIGRFGVGLHNERLVGQVDWSNVGRTTEGLLFQRSLNDDIALIGAALQVSEDNLDDTDGDNVTDPMFYVLDLNFAEKGFDVFVYHLTGDVRSYVPGASSIFGGTRMENFALTTFGVYSKRMLDNGFFYDAMFAMQTGKVDPWDGGDTFDASGMLINAKVGMKLDSGTKVYALFDMTSGDDPDTESELEAFHNLLYTGHKWHGAMDFFVGGYSNVGTYGLTDINLGVWHPINEDLTAGVDFHIFSTTEEYGDGMSSIGNEIDIAVTKKAGDMKITGGLSFFMANEDWVADAETAKWAFVQSTFGF